MKRLSRLLSRLDISVGRYRYTTPVRRVLMLRSARVDLLVDGGANFGQYAREIRAHGYDGRILSFEPLSRSYAALAEAASHDPAWEAINAALGAEPGVATIHRSVSDDFSSLLSNTALQATVRPQSQVIGQETVRVVTVDDAIGTRGTNVGVKLDVQGFEKQALLGGAHTVQRAVYLELELSLAPLYEGQASARELLDLCFDAGFELGWVEPFYLASSGRAMQLNALFVRGEER